MKLLRSLGEFVAMLIRLLAWMIAGTLHVDAKERELLGRAWER